MNVRMTTPFSPEFVFDKTIEERIIDEAVREFKQENPGAEYTVKAELIYDERKILMEVRVIRKN